MASREKIEGFGTVITLSPAEALDLVTLLTGQLAKLPVPGHMAGAAPEITINDRGRIEEKLAFLVDLRMK